MSTEFTLLQEVLLEQEAKDLAKEIMDLHKQFRTVFNEDVRNFAYPTEDPDHLTMLFDQAKQMYQAAIRGLGLANKLKDPQQRAQNKSRVLRNMNQLRAIKTRIDKQLMAAIEKMEQDVGDGLQQGQPQAQDPTQMGQVRNAPLSNQQPGQQQGQPQAGL